MQLQQGALGVPVQDERVGDADGAELHRRWEHFVPIAKNDVSVSCRKIARGKTSPACG